MSLVATGVEFAAFADMNADAWMRISGAALRHAIRGVGSIEAVEPRRNYIPLITVSFGSGDPVRFNSDGFRKGNFPEIEIPDDLEEAFLHWKEEWIKEQERRAADAALRQIEEERTKATRAKLMALATRYNVRITHLLSPVTLETLSRILTKLETGSAFRWETMLSENDLRQLEDKIDLNVQASFYHRQFKETGNLWCLVPAGT